MSMMLLNAQAGDCAVEEGDEACEVFIVKEGSFNVLVGGRKAGTIRAGGSGNRVGDEFGESGLLGGKLLSYTLMAAEPNSKLLVLRQDDFLDGARMPT